eukprot:XP_001696739.1 predicted protein [Chlamydomonas reinhardtii]
MDTAAMQKVWGFLEQFEGYLEAYPQFYSGPQYELGDDSQTSGSSATGTILFSLGGATIKVQYSGGYVMSPTLGSKPILHSVPPLPAPGCVAVVSTYQGAGVDVQAMAAALRMHGCAFHPTRLPVFSATQPSSWSQHLSKLRMGLAGGLAGGRPRKCECGDCPTCKSRDRMSRHLAAERAGVQLKQRKCECGDCPTCKNRDRKRRQRAVQRAAAQQPNKKRGAPSAAASQSKKRRSS